MYYVLLYNLYTMNNTTKPWRTSPYKALDKLTNRMKEKTEMLLKLCPEIKVTETYRTEERQKECIERGVSWVKRSRHQDGEAIDIAFIGNNPYPDDNTLWLKVANKASKCGLKWGYDMWGVDKPHFEDDGKDLISTDNWYKQAWIWALDNGFTEGKVGDTVSLEQLITILHRYDMYRKNGL